MKLYTLMLAVGISFAISACGKRVTEYSVGQRGEKGDTGDTGDTGAGCSADEVAPSAAFPTGGVLIDCGSGTTFLRAGTNGSDATPVTAVKLCPGTTTYPSKFVEVAFCISNKLYGTYSANGGFSTELPPGAYGSNGVNSSCNFVIGANCSVTN